MNWCFESKMTTEIAVAISGKDLRNGKLFELLTLTIFTVLSLLLKRFYRTAFLKHLKTKSARKQHLRSLNDHWDCVL